MLTETRIRVKSTCLSIGMLVAGPAVFAAPLLEPRLAGLAFFATLPWLFFIAASGHRRRGSLVWFLALAYLIAVTTLSWLGAFSLPAWLVSPLIYVPLFIPTFYLARWLRALWPTLPMSLIWGLTFTCGEWLRINLSPGQIPFCQLGAALVPFTKLIQIADVAGASALSTVAALTSGFIFDLGSFVGSAGLKRTRNTLLKSGGLVCAAFGLIVWYGFRSDQPGALMPGPRVEVVQSNMPGWRDDLQSRQKLERAIELTESNSDRADLDLVVWPENSLVPTSDVDPATGDSLTSVWNTASKVKLPILIDGPFDIREFSERHRAALVEPDGALTSYAKQLFVPWSEYAPGESQLRAVEPLWADSYLRFLRARNPSFTPTLSDRDAPMVVFRLSGHDGQIVVFGSPICYEALNPSLVNRWYAALNEDDAKRFFLMNQVNEILVGDSVHNQTLAFSQLRAVEGRVSVIRATNNGISAAIDPNGRIYDRLSDPVTGASTNVAGVFFPQVQLDPRGTRTIYARFGDWWPMTCLIVSLMLLATGYLRTRKESLYGFL
jgi:apolipoprotein N-acyltransferase